MKTIHLLRHAKSSWKDLTIQDFDRPLNNRGKLSAKYMAEKLNKENFKPDHIFCSPAKRTKETYEYFNSVFHFNNKVEFIEKIYEANYPTLLSLINKTDDKLNSVLIIGDNPSRSILASELIEGNINLVTCNIISIQFNVDNWAEIFSGCGELIRFDYPKKNDEFIKILWNSK